MRAGARPVFVFEMLSDTVKRAGGIKATRSLAEAEAKSFGIRWSEYNFYWRAILLSPVQRYLVFEFFE